MSGVEVAGLALGALPILIQAIESYNESLDPLKSFVRWERELPQLIRKLRNEHVHYAQTMRQLLEPITTDFELAEMLSEPGGQLWKDKAMVSKLEGKLQESYFAYQSTVVDIERIMKKIASKLDLDRAAELTRNDLEAIIAANPKKANNDNKFEFRKRVKFGMSKKTIKGLLDELSDCNKELERFADKSEKLDTARKTIKPSFAARLQRIQDLAKYIHASIISSWSCTCRSYHKTSLLLEHREALYAAARAKRPQLRSNTCFTVSFSNPGDHTHPWTLQEAEIVIDEEGTPSTPALPTTKPKMSKSVSFGDNPPPYSPTDPVATISSSVVKDLCASIQELHKSSQCIGFSFDYQHKLLKGPMPRHKETDDGSRSCETVTLADLLNADKSQKALRLSKKERYSLAVNLASSALQLNRTPWFPDSWSAKDIMFYRASHGPHLIDFQHPYVSTTTTELSPESKVRGFQNKNTVLLALAIALLELYFGISAQKHHENEAGSTETTFDANPWNQCAIAYEWAENEQEDLSAAFQGAINHCLRCFGDPSASLQDPEFLQAAVESIVLPLQDELSQFLGKPNS
ncbi:hypothetical protein K491DRAFT_682204 [Lophiostoma macrostomum CBS 122681]|uniref:DUF7580 domain-containing protein n=1 Tax=Lophiostoma macrostomum CBS 122681 TaxID=1314788 RepID=A0A6A6SUX7_9PLEO|nr:hypothetical protein K491DRAFT_682204 [Lophiostoma macrostomum CBS 122681]